MKKSIDTAVSIMLSLLILGIIISYLIKLFAFVDFPAEYRDLSVIKVVDDFAGVRERINPYSTDYYDVMEGPPVLLDSGFLHVFPAVVFMDIFHVSATFSVYVMNFIYFVLELLAIFSIVFMTTRKLPLSLFAVAIESLCLRRHGVLVARPDILATVFILIAIFLLIYHYLRNQHPKWLVTVLALCCIIIFYLKIHYALVVLSLYVFFLLYDRKQIIRFSLWLLIFGCGLFALINCLFPMHFSAWGVRIYEMLTGVGGSGKESGISYVLNKWYQLFRMFFPILCLTIYGIVRRIVYFIQKRQISQMEDFLMINIVINTMALCVLGQHDGADLWYFYFMLMPSVIVYSMIILASFDERSMGLLSLAVVILSVFCLRSQYRSIFHITDYQKGHEEAYDIIREHESPKMLLSSHLAIYSMEHGIYNYNYGDICFMPQTSIQSSLLRRIFPYTDKIEEMYSLQADQIISDIDERKYSLITTDGIDVPFEAFGLSEEFQSSLQKHYELYREVSVPLEMQSVETQFWIPKKD